MAFIPWPDGAQVALHWNNGTFSWANIWAVKMAGFQSGDQLDLADMFATEFRTSMKAFLDASVALNDVVVTDMRTQGASAITSTFGPVQMTGSGQMVPISAAVCVTWRTNLRGRAYRGRSYFAGWLSTYLTDIGLTQAAVDELVSQIGAWRLALANLGWQHCVASEQINKVVRSEGYLVPITSFAVRSLRLASQRRRTDRP